MVRHNLFFLFLWLYYPAVRKGPYLILWSGFLPVVEKFVPRISFPCSFTTDFDAYLAPGCEEWCNQQLRLLDLPAPPCADDFLHDRRIAFPPYYTALRAAARLHYTNGNIEPKLAMLAHPKAGYAWAPAAAVLADMDANFETVGLVEGGNAFAGGVA
jgi:hypothetical protein